MNSVFLRIYSGLIFTLILSLITGGLTFTIVSGIRLQNYRENSVQIPFRVMAKTLLSLPQSEWSQQLNRWEKQLGIKLKTKPDTKFNLKKLWLLRLRQGKLTTRSLNNNTFAAYIIIDRHTILMGKIQNIDQHFLMGSAEVVLDWFKQTTKQELYTKLRELKNEAPQAYNIYISPLTTQTLLPSRQLKMLQQGIPVINISARQEAIKINASNPEQNLLLTLGPWHLFSLYPFQLLMALCIYVLLAMSFATYILVRVLDRRICQIETTAKDISGGKFYARAHIGVPDSVGRLGMAFNTMARHIQSLLSIQQEMIHGISHELRTPVSRIRFALAMIADSNSQQALQQQVDEMDKDIEDLDALIDEILTYARLESAVPDLKLEMTNIETIIGQVIAEYHRTNKNINIRYIKHENPYMTPYAEVEERYIHRAIQNLVGNACYHASKVIEISFMHTNNICHLYVEDDGPGIPAKDRNRIFSAFVRLDDSRARKSGGYGLGLSIVQRIMAWHNGEISVFESRNLHGACFHLSWPREQISRL